MSVLISARSALFTFIQQRLTDLAALNDDREEGQDLAAFVVPSFELVQTYLPRVLLKELEASPRVTVIGLAADQQPSSRGKLHVVDQPVQVCIQAKIDPQSQQDIEQYVLLLEQLQECARETSQVGLTWLKTVALKDKSGTPYDFVKLRDTHTFDGVFTAYYRRGTT